MKTKKSENPKRRVWSVRLILVDRPPMGKLKVDRKFLLKKELLRSLKVSTGYAGVTPSIVDAKLELR
jgi:hypothetical protein